MISARLRTGMLSVNPTTNRKRIGNKSGEAILKDARQLGFVFQDIEPPESLPVLRNGTNVLGSIRRVRFTKAAQRHANIRENRSVARKNQVKIPHQRIVYAIQFQEEIKQERCAPAR